jgi:hypothetical protein
VRVSRVLDLEYAAVNGAAVFLDEPVDVVAVDRRSAVEAEAV